MKFIISALLFISLLNAQIIEVEQVFNKTTTKVKEESRSISKSFYGKVKINEEKIYDVVTRFDGFITGLEANKTFMYIKKNEPLFSIYSDEILKLQKELKISKSINKSLYKASLEKLKALDINEKEINRLKANKVSYQGIKVYSPINALLLKKDINNASAIKKAQTLMQIANIDSLWFIASIYQKDLAFLKENMIASIKLDGVNKTLKTKLDYIYPNVDEKNKSVNVRFIIDNKDLKIYPNMFGKVKIKTNKKSMLTLPKTAVLSKANKYFVFKPISKSEFEPVLVEAKRISSSKYEILDGLSKDEVVLNNALFLLDSDAITNALYESDTDDDW